MKNLFKFLGAFILVTALTFNSNAQFRASGGLELGFALEDDFGLMYGASFGGEYGLADNMGITGQVGYIMNTINSDFFENASSSFIPMQLGYRYYFDSSENGPYVHGQIGVHIYKLSYEYEAITGFDSNFNPTYETQEISASETYLSYAAGGGVIVNEKIDIGLRFNIISADGGSFEYIGVRTAYNF